MTTTPTIGIGLSATAGAAGSRSPITSFTGDGSCPFGWTAPDQIWAM